MPERIGPYRVIGLLGEGGMGKVYEAEQEQPRRKVALKVMRGEHAVDDVHTRMFQREVETLARLKHPNIAAFYDAQVKEASKGLTSRCAPRLITLMGVIVGGVVLSVFLPILDVVGTLSGE